MTTTERAVELLEDGRSARQVARETGLSIHWVWELRRRVREGSQATIAVNGKRTTLEKRRCRQCGADMYTPVCKACQLKEANRRERRRFVELDPQITMQLDDPEHRLRYLEVRESRRREPHRRATADGELVFLGEDVGEDGDEAEVP